MLHKSLHEVPPKTRYLFNFKKTHFSPRRLRLREHRIQVLLGQSNSRQGTKLCRMQLRRITLRLLPRWSRGGARTELRGLPQSTVEPERRVWFAQGPRHLSRLHRQVVLRPGLRRLLEILVRRLRGQRQSIQDPGGVQGRVRRA